MKTLNVYNNNMPSSINKIGGVVNDILNYLQNNFGQLDNCTLFELKVILNEMLLNAVKHGNKEDEGKHVKVIAGLTNNGFVYFLVEDEGSGYDFKYVCGNSTNVYDESDFYNITESGRGILIIKSLCDKVKVNERGNKIVALKRLYQS